MPDQCEIARKLLPNRLGNFQILVSCGYTLRNAVLQPDTRFRVRNRLISQSLL